MEASAQRAVDALLDKYAESHRNPVNELIHCVCVPAIVFSVLGLVWAIHPWAAAGLVAVSMIYYFSLSVPFAFGMAVMSGLFLAVLNLMPATMVLPVSLTVFVVAWIGQFIGHKIEGKKPSFFDDLRFLAIGPLFVLGVWYRRLGVAY
ncbi:Mpo1 family 2-hydroxy fatty acid dioxygenase [Lacisediminimonas profundi]|uniref:Mpo1 family 2-hydroxy fatty acid dioxygenase n=1 Tax=Lacisediminimonas profundi TaxID=2603856 RepID=UPI00124AF5F0|nr:Mpo1-like protein [Lacisediminimonas profundi]